MHRCILIPEIVHLICAELGNVCARKSLAGLAQTCLWFREPALDALWYQLHDLSPLFKCMPPDLWEEIGVRRRLVRLILFLYLISHSC
jgi:hypothetical protein